MCHDKVQAAAKLLSHHLVTTWPPPGHHHHRWYWKDAMVVATATKKTSTPTTFIRARVRPWAYRTAEASGAVRRTGGYRDARHVSAVAVIDRWVGSSDEMADKLDREWLGHSFHFPPLQTSSLGNTL